MTVGDAFKTLTENICQQCAYGAHCMHECDIRGCDNRDAIERLMLYCNKKKTEKTSKWIDRTEDGYVECPVCGHATTCEYNDEIEDLHYCFWCGTRMEVGKEVDE